MLPSLTNFLSLIGGIWSYEGISVVLFKHRMFVYCYSQLELKFKFNSSPNTRWSYSASGYLTSREH